MSAQTRTSALIGAATPWLKSVVDLIYPRNCLFCSEPLAETERGVICAACLGTVKFIEPPFCCRCALPFAGATTENFVCGYCKDLEFHFSRAVAACRGDGVVRESIHRFKYNREMYYGPHLAEWLANAAKQWIDWNQVDAIVSVPLHPRKKRAREFNQAEYLAVALRRVFQVPVLDRNLRRVKETVTQTSLHAKERTANLRDAFATRDAQVLAGKRLVLVDDVFTTGATMDSCAKVLLKAGAEDVIALAVARGV
jgi:ComF family protein